MAITREEFFNKKANASLWDVAVSIKRGNPLPLDRDSVFESYATLQTYAADVLAYPGQVVAVVNEDSTGIYYLDQNLAIQPVGIIPTGDSKSIEVTANGVISLLGAKDAANGTLPMIGEDGKLTWKTLEDIGAGDGNDNTTYEITALEKGEEDTKETYGIQIQVKENGIATGDPIIIDFDVYTKSEADTLLEALDTRIETLENKEDKDTTYSVKAEEKILKLEGTEFSTVASLKYIAATETAAAKIQLLGINEAVVSEIDATPFIKDGMLDDVEYNPDNNTLTFTWNTESGPKTDEVVLSDIIEAYTAGAGLELAGNEFAVKVATDSEAFLTADANGIKVSGIQDAINAAKGEAATDAQSKADAAKQAAIDDAATKYATTGALSGLETAIDGRLDVLEAIDHTLYATKAELEPVATAASNAETAVGNLESRFDEIVAVGGEPNAINKIQVNGKELTITEKTVNIEVPTALSGLEGWAALDERVTAAKTQADTGVSTANAAQATADNNAIEIGKHETRIGNLETAKGNHETRILNLENADSTHAAEYLALKERVDAHNESLAKKAEQTALDAVSTKANANETAISTLNNTTLPALKAELNTEINKKANAADVYTKTEVGTITEGKTLVEMINEAKSEASYDDTEVRGLITDNSNAIKAIYVAGSEGVGATGVLVDEIARVEGLLSTEKTRAEAAEADLDSRLDKVELFWETAYEDGEDINVINTLREIQDYIKSDETGASAMASSIQANKQAIEAIYLPGEGETPAQGLLVTEVARVEGLVNTNTQAIAAINHSETGILATAKKYTDDQIAALPSNGPIAGALLGLVKSSDADNKIKVETDGTMSVNRISVDKLFVADGDELILNGGNAS